MEAWHYKAPAHIIIYIVLFSTPPPTQYVIQSLTPNTKAFIKIFFSKNVPRHTQTLIYFIFLAAKITIATSWKSPVIDIAFMKHKLTWIMLNEKILSSLREKQFLFIEIWSAWLTYLQVPDIGSWRAKEEPQTVSPSFFLFTFLFYSFLANHVIAYSSPNISSLTHDIMSSGEQCPH